MSDEARAARGSRAKAELAETEAAFDAVRAAILEALIKTPPTQGDVILTLHMAAQNLDAVKKALRGVIDDGLVARAALEAAGLLS